MGCLALLVAASVQVPGRAAEAALPRLMGIVVAGTLRLATFADPQGPGWQTVREGDQIGAYRVYLITPREVGLEGSGGRHLVQTGSDPASRSDRGPVAQPVPLNDPYRREAYFENDQ